jgi:hypothetical protein
MLSKKSSKQSRTGGGAHRVTAFKANISANSGHFQNFFKVLFGGIRWVTVIKKNRGEKSLITVPLRMQPYFVEEEASDTFTLLRHISTEHKNLVMLFNQ